MRDLQDSLLSTAEAVAFLARLGVKTSRRTIDQLRTDGTLPAIEARGRIKYLYQRNELIDAFTKDHDPCLSLSGARKAETSTCAAPSRANTFMKALALATAPQQMYSAHDARQKCSHVVPMAKAQR